MTQLAFFVDVDNTLLDNDTAKEDFDKHLQVELGPELTKRYWELYEEARKETGVVDIPLALKRLRDETPLEKMDEKTFLHAKSIFDNYPFFQRLYPNVLETIQHLNTLGTVAIVSDGDLVFQAEKIFSSNLADAVGGRVLLYIHKQEHLDEIRLRYPADHYVMIDDKPSILVDSKAKLGDTLTTVFVEQGKYAKEGFPGNFQPDLSVLHIGDLMTYSTEQFLLPQKK
ncbi:MAG TPA: hypothetical protein VFN23_02295 [Ktedonobacteraceae bacterium]|nr:hypothetical protein [Ktedonobacteraceae bacterium]